MKKLVLTAILILASFKYCCSQDYELIHEVFEGYKSDTIFLDKSFITDYTIKVKFFDKYNFNEWWTPIPIPHPKTPPIKPFLNKFDLKLMRNELLINKKRDTLIDFTKLENRFYLTDNTYRNKNVRNTYISISKPIFNSTDDWAIIIVFSANRGYDIGSGNLHIYRKIDNQWELYHKLSLWIS